MWIRERKIPCDCALESASRLPQAATSKSAAPATPARHEITKLRPASTHALWPTSRKIGAHTHKRARSE